MRLPYKMLVFRNFVKIYRSLFMRNKFVDKTAAFIHTNSLIKQQDTILVGLSGGADSVALLNVLHELGYKCIAAHCNFHLRGEESNRDEKFCRALCDRIGIKLLTKDFDVKSAMLATGESVEMACRTLRYDWWKSILEAGQASLLAVGHHIEDNVETFFINMLRGCGIQGLKGMIPKSGNIIRPLLSATRKEIEEYLSITGMSYVTDSTNAENEYRRNIIRNIILPQIEQYFPDATLSINKTIGYLRENYELYSTYEAELRRKHISPNGRIDISRIVTNEPYPRMVLFEIISPMGFNMTNVDNILRSFNGENACPVSGRYFISDNISLLLDRGYLIPCDTSINPIHDVNQEVSLDRKPFSSFSISLKQFEDMKKGGKLSTQSLYLDSKILKEPHKFILRNWQPGDRISPFGMKGTKLLSDIFSDAKISLEQKKRIRILTCDDNIIWVIGLRTSRHFAVTAKTDSVLIVNFNTTDSDIS